MPSITFVPATHGWDMTVVDGEGTKTAFHIMSANEAVTALKVWTASAARPSPQSNQSMASDLRPMSPIGGLA